MITLEFFIVLQLSFSLLIDSKGTVYLRKNTTRGESKMEVLSTLFIHMAVTILSMYFWTIFKWCTYKTALQCDGKFI